LCARAVDPTAEPLLCCLYVEIVSWLLAVAPDDPLLLAGALVAAWLPICAVALGLLALIAALQAQFGWRPKPQPSIMLPPAELRPLVVPRIVSTSRQRIGVQTLARLLLAIGAVVGLTALMLLASGRLLLAALPG
jgi:hypothetical protein